MANKGKGKKKQKGGKPKNIYVVQNGEGFFGDLWSGVKKVAGFANDVAKKTGIVGNLAKNIPGIGNIASAGLKMAGYGSKRKRMKGGGNTSGNLGKLGLGAQPQPTIPL